MKLDQLKPVPLTDQVAYTAPGGMTPFLDRPSINAAISSALIGSLASWAGAVEKRLAVLRAGKHVRAVLSSVRLRLAELRRIADRRARRAGREMAATRRASEIAEQLSVEDSPDEWEGRLAFWGLGKDLAPEIFDPKDVDYLDWATA